MSRFLRGTPIRTRNPVLTQYVTDASTLQALTGSGTISEGGVTTLTGTATGLVYQLPAVSPGMQVRLALKYTGQTDDLVIACNTTAEFFGVVGSNNNITVSSSQTTVAIDLYGISTSRWGVSFSGDRGGGSTSIVYTASTVKSTTDVT